MTLTIACELVWDSDGLGALSLLELHWPVSWLTLSGLLMSCGLVPMGCRCGGGPR